MSTTTFKENWNNSMKNFTNTKTLALMAVTVALKVIASAMYVPVGENLQVGISFLIVAIQATLFGPAAGMILAFITDIISFMLFPNGPFFIGYALTAMLGIFIYSMFFYQKQITLTKIILAKTMTNYLVNVLLGSLWTAMLYSKGYYYYMMKSLVKNTILLPIQILVLASLFAILLPFFEKKGFVIPQNQKEFKFKNIFAIK